MFLIAPDLGGDLKLLTSPPFEFSVDIPDDIKRAGGYIVQVDGYTESRVEVKSDAVLIDLERTESPLSLRGEPSDGPRLPSGGAYILPVREQLSIDVNGSFSNGKTLDLSYSTLTKISSDNPTVAVVETDGRMYVVKTVAPGSAKLSITNGKANAEIQLRIITRPAYSELVEKLFPPEKQNQ